MRMLSVGYIPEDCSSLVDSGAPTQSAMPILGTRPKYKTCNINRLAGPKYKTSA